MDLKQDLKEIIRDELREIKNITKKEDITLEFENESELLKEYLTLMLKLVPIKPRKVKYSEELDTKIQNKEIPLKYLNILNCVHSKFENGMI